MFFALSVSGSDALIAKYNVDRYLEGSLDRIIVSDLEKLGDAALPQYIRLEKELKERENAVTSDTMYEYFEKISSEDGMHDPEKRIYSPVMVLILNNVKIIPEQGRTAYFLFRSLIMDLQALSGKLLHFPSVFREL